MAGSDYDWAGNSVPWDPELPIFEPSHNLLLEVGTWTVPYCDFTPPAGPFALEMRAETIEQLAGGDALRRGESERIEAGRSQTNADLVAGRDRVRVQGTLREHTGHGLAEQTAHLHTTVDGRLDVHAASEDTVLLAGHMRDLWDGGTAIVAAVTDDLVAGGGVRVTAPLDLWMHGLMGVEERIGTCTADAVLLEMSATHYEREYGPGAHVAGLASYTGSLYQSNRSTFRALMRISSGVRNLIAGGGRGGAGGAPDASPPPAPAAGDAGTDTVSDTLSAATGSARSVESVVESGPRSEGLTELRRFSDVSDVSEAVRSEDLAATNQAPAAQLDNLADSLRRAGVETGEQAGAGSPYSAGSDWRVPQEGVERSDTQMGLLDEILDYFDTMFATEPADSSLFPRTDDHTGLSRSADSAERLVALQRGDMDTAILQPIGSPTPSGMDDVQYAGEIPDASISVPGRDEIPPDPARFEGYESVSGADIAQPPEIPRDRGWGGNFAELVLKFIRYRRTREWHPLLEYTRAVVSVSADVRVAYLELGGNAADLTRYPGATGAPTIYKRIEEMATQADAAGEAQRVAQIREALKVLDQLTYEFVTNLAERAGDFDGTSDWMARYRRLDPAMDEVKLANWIQEQIDAVGLELGNLDVSMDSDAVQRLDYEQTYFTEMMQEVARGRDPTFHSNFEIAYWRDTEHGEQADILTTLHDRLRDAMADPKMQRVHAAPRPVPPDLANLPLYDRSGNFIHAPGSAYVPRPNANRMDDVDGAVDAANVAGSVLEIPRSASDGSLSSSWGNTPPGVFVSPEGSVPASPVVGAAPGLDGNAASWPVVADGFRLTDDLELRSGPQRAGEPLSDVPQRLDESYGRTDFGMFRRIDDAAPDAPDEIGPRTGPSSEGQGGQSGTSGGQRGAGFGQAEIEGASPRGWQADATPGFGRLERPPAANVRFSDQGTIVQKIVNGRALAVEDVGLLRDRFRDAASSGEIGRETEQSRSMIALIGQLTRLANSSELSPDLYARFSDADWQALELLLRMLATPGRTS